MKFKIDRSSGKKTALCTLIALVLLFFAQITKLLAQYFLKDAPYDARRIDIIPGWISLEYMENPAIAFGIGTGNHPFMVAVTVLTAILIVLIIVLVYAVFRKNLPVRMSLAIIEAGAIGNFIDRLCVFDASGQRVVRDFVNLSRFHFGVCNIADFCITLGAVMLIFIILFIGPRAVFPLKKEWREQAKREESEHETK